MELRNVNVEAKTHCTEKSLHPDLKSAEKASIDQFRAMHSDIDAALRSSEQLHESSGALQETLAKNQDNGTSNVKKPQVLLHEILAKNDIGVKATPSPTSTADGAQNSQNVGLNEQMGGKPNTAEISMHGFAKDASDRGKEFKNSKRAPILVNRMAELLAVGLAQERQTASPEEILLSVRAAKAVKGKGQEQMAPKLEELSPSVNTRTRKAAKGKGRKKQMVAG